jgi:acetylornithine deacetylase/succinyl-diaminopimelate desuccinylase-like protein
MPSSSSVETLLEKNFKPTRTIVLAFGFDEEASGTHASYTIYDLPCGPKSNSDRVP